MRIISSISAILLAITLPLMEPSMSPMEAAGLVRTPVSASPGKKPKAILTMSPLSSDTPLLKGTGGETNITISSRADWSISSDADWFTASPSSGKRGRKKVSLITYPNETGRDRTATVTIIADGEEHIFTVRQRADIFSRKAIISGHVTNQGVLYYNSSALTKVFFVLPCPVTNEYQDISNLNAPGCRRSECPDGINHYVSKTIKNAKETVMAQSGSHTVTETFDATVYQVTTDFSLITDIPDYDPRSEECKLFLMKESDHIDPTHKKIVSVSNMLWSEAGGDIIGYARLCSDWTHDNMTYTTVHPKNVTFSYLMQNMKGECGNFSTVFIALLRAKGIPARHIAMVNPKDGSYHMRAEFYIPAYGWIPADPTWGKGNFGVFKGEFVVMCRGSVISLRDTEGEEFVSQSLQKYFYHYYYQNTQGSLSAKHSCWGLR